MKRILAVVVGLLVLLAGAVGSMLWLEADGGHVPAQEKRSAASAEAESTPRAAEVGEPASDREVVEPATTEARAPETVILRGRAVDEQGVPLAGVRARLHGWASSDERLDVHRASTREPIDWQDPAPIETSADGRFEFSFVPPPPYQFVLHLQAAQRCRVSGDWSAEGLDAVLDLGDVVVPLGARVTGRVLEAGGEVPATDGPLANVSLHRQWRDPRVPPEVVTPSQFTTQMGPDGSFLFADPVPVGTFTVAVQGFRLASGAEVQVERPDTDLQVRVRPRPVGEPIEGIVVSAVDGRGIARARVSTNTGIGANTDAEGRFVLRPTAGRENDGPFRLDVHAEGFENGVAEQAVDWGAREVRIALQPGRVLDLLVVRADDGTPVEWYGARVMPEPGFAGSWSNVRDVKGGWEHPGGRLRIPGLREGEQALIVEPGEDSGLVQALHPLLVGQGPLAPVTVELETAQQQTVIVRNAAGEPIAGSRVELIDFAGEEVTVRSHVRNLDPDRGWGTADRGLVLNAGTSGADGRCTLHGPRSRILALRCQGEHPALVQNGVVLSDAPIELVVPVGATLTVRVEPVEVVAKWSEVAGMPFPPSESGERGNSGPDIVLDRLVGNRTESFPDSRSGQRSTIDGAGTATLTGIPPGEWTLSIRRPVRLGIATRWETIDLQQGLVLAEGSTSELRFDIARWTITALRGAVRLDGQPAPTGSVVYFERSLPPPTAGERDQKLQAFAQVGPEGRFEVDLLVGSWNARLALTEGPHADAAIPLESPVIVRDDDGPEVTLEVSSASRRIRLVDPAGQPVEGVSPILVRVDEGPRGEPRATPTDAQGESELFGARGRYRLRARIRSLTSPVDLHEHQRKLMEEHGQDFDAMRAATDATLVDVAVVELLAGAAAGEPLAIQLPADWDR